MTALIVLIVVILAAVVVGLPVRARAGKVRPAAAAPAPRADLLATVGVTGSVPTVLHFSADWCGPCAAVRRVVAQTVAELAESPCPPADIELDIDAHPSLAKELGVLSLPTTFIFDRAANERFRISGVPSAVDLRTALVPLTA